MSEFLDKISSYNIFNYLLPGALFAFVGEMISIYHFTPEDAVTTAFAYYFYGLLVSRIGSLAVEPVLKKYGVLEFAEYELFVAASKNDPKLEVLSEQNNTYRSLISVVVCLFGLKIYELTLSVVPILTSMAPYALALVVLMLLIASYRKQTNYITKRVNASKEK